MVFSSLIFLYRFLPICILLYFLSPTIRIKNYVLLIASLIFYAWGEPVYVLLLIASAAVNFFLGKVVGDRERKGSTFCFWLAVVFDLGMLFVFKYTDFLLENINALLGVNIPLTGLSLPIGISFYTFQTLSYVIDVRRGSVQVQKSFASFLLFVSLFPQLIAGPILRYSEIEAQLKRRRYRIEDVFYGITRFCIGLGKKVLIANYAGSVASQMLDANMAQQTTLGVWFGAVMFSLQIYFDFSGYSDMAIGLGRMFGFHYGENFDLPYLSKSATEFWRRWHISLGSFFRDYVYIPLGGNRKHQLLNILIVWALTGLWHGASWNFVIWGLYFGVLIAVEKYCMKYLEKIPAVIRHIVMVFVIVIGWTLFYYTDFTQLKAALGVMFGGGVGWSNATTKIQLRSSILLLLVGVIGSTGIPRKIGMVITGLCTSFERKSWNTVYLVLVFVFNLALLLLTTISLVGSSYNPFLYFRF